MKLFRISFAAFMALAVGASVPAFAQHDHDGDSRQENKDKGKGKGNDHGSRNGGDRQDRDWHGDRGHNDDHARREDHDRHEVRDRRDDHDRHEAREWHEDRDRHEDRDWHEDRDRHDNGRHLGWRDRDWAHERHEHEEWAEHHHRHYIREDHYVAYFGYEHRFRIVRPVIVAGHARFRYGGYWFVIARPLPPGWRYDDDVYVDYIDDGYYMCSPVHPGVRISIDIL